MKVQLDSTRQSNCPRLFKQDSTGKIRFLDIYSSNNKLYQDSGVLDGKIVSHEKICASKNAGKSNATTGTQQALKEAKAKYDKKLKEGYFKTVEEAKNNTLILPMLAKEYGKESHKINWGNEVVYAQRKLDGIRCLGIPGKPNSLVSRKNRPIDTMHHIAKRVEDIKDFPYPFDGELYIKGKSFQEITKLVKKYRNSFSEEVKYYIYDIVAPELTFEERMNILNKFFSTPRPMCLEHVLTYELAHEDHMKDLHSQFVSTGYEGTMIRLGSSKYKMAGRSSGLLKYKDFQDINVTIKDVIPMEARPSQGIFLCELPDGRTFKATPKCSVTQKEAILNNRQKLQGTEVEIRFFELTDDGIPRFPVAIVDLDD